MPRRRRKRASRHFVAVSFYAIPAAERGASVLRTLRRVPSLDIVRKTALAYHGVTFHCGILRYYIVAYERINTGGGIIGGADRRAAFADTVARPALSCVTVFAGAWPVAMVWLVWSNESGMQACLCLPFFLQTLQPACCL